MAVGPNGAQLLMPGAAGVGATPSAALILRASLSALSRSLESASSSLPNRRSALSSRQRRFGSSVGGAIGLTLAEALRLLVFLVCVFLLAMGDLLFGCR